MRRLIFSILLTMCALSAFSYNESVAAISFNPSRLGAYTHLKAVTKAKLAGGLDTNQNEAVLNIKSKGTVTLQDDNTDHACSLEHCTGDINTSNGNLNMIQSLMPLEVEAGQSITTKAVMTKAVMKNATNYPADNNYSVEQQAPRIQGTSNTAAQTAGTSVTMKGGTFKATEDSYIHHFTPQSPSNGATLSKLEITAKQLDVKNNFHVLTSFQLGSITITPADSSSCIGGKCKKYQFVERLNIKNGENKKYKVLAVKVN